MLAATPASAFRTSASDPGFASTEAARWLPSNVDYVIAVPVPDEVKPDEVEAAVGAAFAEWSSPDCAGLSFRFGGGTTQLAAAGDGVNTIQWVYSNWRARGFDASAPGATDVQYVRQSDGYWQIVEADIYLNAEGFRWTVKPVADDPAARSLPWVMRHEVGHLLGLLHSCEFDASAVTSDCAANPGAAQTVMYPLYGPQDAQLSADDAAGVCSLYPRGSGLADGGAVDGRTQGKACSNESPGASCGATPGPAAAGDPCAASADCSTGLCGVNGLCERQCAADKDCGPRGRCVADATGGLRHCTGLAALGAPCDYSDDCAGGQCLAQAGSAAVCTRECDPQGAARSVSTNLRQRVS